MVQLTVTHLSLPASPNQKVRHPTAHPNDYVRSRPTLTRVEPPVVRDAPEGPYWASLWYDGDVYLRNGVVDR